MSQAMNNQEDQSINRSLEDIRKRTEGIKPASPVSTTETTVPEPESIVRSARRRLTANYKLDILKEIDRCISVDHVGAILRREGLYSSQICEWRKARKAGALDALSKKRGRRIKKSPQEKQIEQLKAETQRLQAKLEEAGAIIDIQKKVSEILGNKIQKD